MDKWILGLPPLKLDTNVTRSWFVAKYCLVFTNQNMLLNAYF